MTCFRTLAMNMDNIALEKPKTRPKVHMQSRGFMCVGQEIPARGSNPWRFVSWTLAQILVEEAWNTTTYPSVILLSGTLFTLAVYGQSRPISCIVGSSCFKCKNVHEILKDHDFLCDATPTTYCANQRPILLWMGYHICFYNLFLKNV